MSCRSKKLSNAVAAALLLFVLPRITSPQAGIIELRFEQSPTAESDTSRTLQSLIKVQGSGSLCQDALYLITHYGDREALFERTNQQAKDDPLRNHTWRYCSVFASATDRGVFMGRNWDNQNVGSIIVSLYHPPNGYASISFSRAIDMGFPLNLDLEQIKSGGLGDGLLLAPFHAMDGINDQGLAVAIAGLKEVTHTLPRGRDRVYVTFLIRRMLDQARTVDEAVNLAAQFTPFDLDSNSLNGHIMIADAAGRSVILEYTQDEWRVIPGDTSWQVMTTSPVYNVPDLELRDKCWRYRGISEALEQQQGVTDWEAAIEILQGAQQQGTTWSVAYSLPTTELYFCVYQNWDTVYRLRLR